MFSINYYIKTFLLFTIIAFYSCNAPQPATTNVGDTINEQENIPMLPPPPSIKPNNDSHNPEPQVAKEIDGMVINYSTNKDDDIDKLLIKSNNDNLLFHFPPHTAKFLLSVAAKNTAVHIWYVDGHKPPKNNNDKVQFELIAMQSKANNNKVNVHDIPPPPPDIGKAITISSNKIQWQNNDAENSNLIVSGRLIALPPHAKESLLPLIKNAHSILIKGYERSAANGFVNMSGLILVRPDAITIDSINYLIR